MPPVAGTVATRSYRARAKAVALSFLKAHPNGRFFVLTVDGSADPEPLEGVEWLGPEDLDLGHLFEMRLRYTPVELCCALKCTLARLALERSPGSPFLYLDSDMLVYRELGELWDAAARSSIVLVPHWIGFADSQTLFERERDYLESGVYNAGCFAVKNSAESRAFLTWWEERVRFDCRLVPQEGVFFDQKWLELAPGIFGDHEVLRDPTYDVAYWNLFERLLERGPRGFEIDGRPLAVFHFSGLNLREKRFAPFKALNLEVGAGSALEELVREYVDLHHDLGHDTEVAIPYRSPVFENGVSSDFVFHRLYRFLSRQERDRLGDPFRTGSPGHFFDWATSAHDSSGISPYLKTLYDLREDLRKAFPDLAGSDRLAFLQWAMKSGAREAGYDPGVMRIPELVSLAARAPAESSTNAAPFGVSERVRGLLAAARGRFLRPKESGYATEFFLELEDLQSPRYPAMAASVRNLFSPASVLDIGCGTGGLLMAFSKQGVMRCRGLEFSSAALRLCRTRGVKARFADLSRPCRIDPKSDLAICLEVAEHLPPESASQVVENLARGPRLLIFSAARPGQGGHEHLNERPHRYWVELFAGRGMILDSEATFLLRRAWLAAEVAPWFSNNVHVFRRIQPRDPPNPIP